MKPSVILYKALPDDFTATPARTFHRSPVANLSPQTVEQNAAILPKLKACWVQTRMLMPHCWKNAETACHINDLRRL